MAFHLREYPTEVLIANCFAPDFVEMGQNCFKKNTAAFPRGSFIPIIPPDGALMHSWNSAEQLETDVGSCLIKGTDAWLFYERSETPPRYNALNTFNGCTMVLGRLPSKLSHLGNGQSNCHPACLSNRWKDTVGACGEQDIQGGPELWE